MTQLPEAHWSEKIDITGTFSLGREDFESPGSKESIGQDPFGAHIGMTWGQMMPMTNISFEDSDSDGEHYHHPDFSNIRYRLEDVVVVLEPTVDSIRTESDHIRVKVQILQDRNVITSNTGWHDYPRNNRLCVLGPTSLILQRIDERILTLKVSILKERNPEITPSVPLPSVALLKKHFALVHRNLTGQNFNDLIFFLYRRQPADADDINSIGKVYANKDFLVGVSEHFALCEFSLHPI
jgi:hypothetical protein